MHENPLFGASPTEIPLPSAPLVRVIAQVRFPLVASVDRREFIAPFQEAIRAEYPVLRPEVAPNMSVQAGEPMSVHVRSNVVWRFHELGQPWRVTLAADFLALETTSYTSRADFFARFERLLEALQRHVQPGAVDRVGVRYIDRLTGAPMHQLADFIQPALLGAFGSGLAPHAVIALSEGLFNLPDEAGQLRARWGLVPPNATVDPMAIEAVSERSWVLDVDAFHEGERAFVSGELAAQARQLAARAYAFFRWSVTDRFLSHFGGAA